MMLPKGEQVYYAKHWGMACEGCGGAESGTPIPMPKKKSRSSKIPAGGAMQGEKTGRKCEDGIWRYELGSIGEAVRDALDDYAQNDGNAEMFRKRLREALSGKDSWSNHYTRERFMAALSDPPKHLLDAVDRMREVLVEDVVAPSAPRRKVRRGQEWGEDLDVDRFLSRDPTPWDRSVRERQARRTVTIGCNLSINGGHRPEELLYRGAAALALADVLTSRGFNVGIVLFESRTRATTVANQIVTRYTLKDPTMPLDVGAAAFSMCEIAWFRIVGAIGALRHYPGYASDGLGSAEMLPEADRAGLDYFIDSDVLSERRAVEWLKGCLSTTESEACHV